MRTDCCSNSFSFNVQSNGCFARFDCHPRPHFTYVIYRLVIFVYFFAWLIYHGLWTEENGLGGVYFIYLTNWNFTLLSVCNLFKVGVAVYAVFVARAEHTGSEKAKSQDEEAMDMEDWEPTPWFYKVYWASNTVGAVTSILIVAGYWLFLYDTDMLPEVTARDLHVHGVNGVFALADVFISATPWRLGHVWVGQVYGVIYSLFTVVYWAVGGKNEYGQPYIYEVINYEEDVGKAVGVGLGLIFIAIPVCHVILWGLNKLSILIGKTCCCYRDGRSGSTVHP